MQRWTDMELKALGWTCLLCMWHGKYHLRVARRSGPLCGHPRVWPPTRRNAIGGRWLEARPAVGCQGGQPDTASIGEVVDGRRNHGNKVAIVVIHASGCPKTIICFNNDLRLLRRLFPLAASARQLLSSPTSVISMCICAVSTASARPVRSVDLEPRVADLYSL